MHYSWLVAHIAEREHISVLWIGHQQAVSYRRQNNLPDKNDLADAMAIALKSKRPQSEVGQLIANKYDDLVRQFENDRSVRQKLLAAQTKEKALKSMRKIVIANLKPHIDGEQLTNQILLMETMFNASWTSNVEVKSLNKNQAMRKFGKLIIGKTTGYAARWLYRLLMKNCFNNEQ